jgi:murein DD-endopeptidase MepM/ murein hydrolase activator NlpD
MSNSNSQEQEKKNPLQHLIGYSFSQLFQSSFFARLVKSFTVLLTLSTAYPIFAETFSIDGFALNTNNSIRKYDTRPEVLMWLLNNSDLDQNWDRLASNFPNAVMLRNKTTNACLNSHYNAVSKTNTWSPCNPSDYDMAWILQGQSDGTTVLKNQRSQLCLQIANRANYGVANMQPCNTSNRDQKWTSSISQNPNPAKYFESLVSWSDTTWENAINSGAAITAINSNPNLDQSKVYRDLSNDLFGKFFPIGGAYISDDYYRETGGSVGYHGAIDISATFGTPVKTLVSGKVTVADMRWGLLTIQDANGINHIYMHLSKFLVSQGQSVSAGQIVANTGNTSAASPHLHYEIARGAYPYGALQTPAAKTKDDFRARTYNPLKDYWLMRRR